MIMEDETVDVIVPTTINTENNSQKDAWIQVVNNKTNKLFW